VRAIRRGFVLPAALAALAAAVTAEPVVTCPRASVPPILDGNVTDAEWVAAGRLSPFLLLQGQGLPSQATDVRVMYDDSALYIAAVLHDANVDQLRAEVTETDGPVWADDCFEVFIDAMGKGTSYVHMVVNSRGTMFDELDHDPLENFQWNPAVAVKEGLWSVEMSVPFGAKAPAPGAMWRLGIARNAAHLGELSSWNGFLTGFHEPALFGQLRFGGPPISFILADIGARKLGANSAALVVGSAAAQPLELKANVRVTAPDKPGHFFGSTRFTAQPASRASLNLPYEVRQEGDGSVLVSITDSEGAVLYRTAPFPVRVPMVAAALFGVEAALADANRQWARLQDSPAKTELRTAIDALSDEWADLAAPAAQRAALSTRDLVELEAALKALRDRLARLGVSLQAAASPGPLPAFAVTPLSSLQKVLADEVTLPSAVAAHLDACRNEWESLQLIIRPIQRRSVRVSIAHTGLQGAGGVILPEQVLISAVGFVPAVNHLARAEGKRLWPDIIGPPLEVRGPGSLDAVHPVEVPPTTAQPLWVSVHVPTDTPPGEYAGEVRLSEDGNEPIIVPLTVTVHRAVLPDPTRFRFCLDLWQSPESIADRYQCERWSGKHWQLLRPYLQNLAAHGQRLVTVGRDMIEWRRNEAGQLVFDYTVFDRYVKLCREVGIDGGMEYLGMFNPGGDTTTSWVAADGSGQSVAANPGDQSFDEAWAAFLADFAQHLAANGWLENVFLCPADEPRDSPGLPTLQRFTRCAELVHAASPKFRTTAALDSRESAGKLAPILDRMVLKLRDDVYSRPLIAKKRAAGGRVEAYVCCHPDRPNTFITSPSVDTRVIPWLLFREGLGGLLRWSYERWPADPSGQPEGDGQLPPGDLFLVYPGPEGPYLSPRWEVLRDGIEDFECLGILKQAMVHARAAGRKAEADRLERVLLATVNRVTGEGAGLTTFTQDPATFAAVRLDMLKTLDNLLAAGTKP